MSVRKTKSNMLLNITVPRKARGKSPEKQVPEKRAGPLPRIRRDIFEDPVRSAEKKDTLWNRFAGQFKKPGDGTWAATAGVAASVPAVLMGAAAVSPQASAVNPQESNNDNVRTDENSPVEIADEVLNGTSRNERATPQEFPPPGTFAEKTWNKVDRNRNGSINSAEIKKYLSSVGVSPGFLGLVHKQAASEVMKMADLNKDGKVSKFEVKSVIKKELRDDEFDAQGKVKPEVIEKGFKKLDSNRSGAVSKSELEAVVKKTMASNSMFGGTIASIARKIGMDVLDANKSGAISRTEFESAAKDLAAIRASVLDSN